MSSQSLVPLDFRYVRHRGKVVPRAVAEKMRSRQNLKDNVGAGKIRLSPEEVQAVRQAADKANAAQGYRYPEVYQKLLFGDTPLP